MGIDIGSETIKVVELRRSHSGQQCSRRALVEHHKRPHEALRRLLAQWRWGEVDRAAICGRLGRRTRLFRIPTQQALLAGLEQLRVELPCTLVTIGSRGFSVLEARSDAPATFRDNGRCSQGTGNFLRQLVERFQMTLRQASELSADVADPASLSGRCPVILKTDMTHLANLGQSRARILAGLFDAVCENVQVLIKPGAGPQRLLLAGGVSRSARVRANFRAFCARHGLQYVEPVDSDDVIYIDALGCASIAARDPAAEVACDHEQLFDVASTSPMAILPPLSQYLDRVDRRLAVPLRPPTAGGRLLLGLDIGSTGSKAVALDSASKDVVWHGYVPTRGVPVQAAQQLIQRLIASPAGAAAVVAVGVTGSGREIVGSLTSLCLGASAVLVINEIAAHAAGAMAHDREVDTIFEIGGQDAKYIRLAQGRVVDAAMNEACSAGTGSFIEEQCRRFEGLGDVVRLGRAAVDAPGSAALGQHCSVFISEQVDDAVAAGIDRPSIIAGLYDSVISNYLNRVKGNRDVGQVIFCQGMPFSSPALAAAVARHTGSRVIVPPDPGLVGAFGVALLAGHELAAGEARASALDLRGFLSAEVTRKDTFRCRSTKGCGGSGNRCRIDRIRTVVHGKRGVFTWGGSCSLFQRSGRRRKLPDCTIDPFRERDDWIERLAARLSRPQGGRRLAMTDEFMLKSLFPLFATLLHELGFDLRILRAADRQTLKRGIDGANVPYCAPMQQFHGLVAAMADSDDADLLFVPMLRGIPRVGHEPFAETCPIAQGCADILGWDLKVRQRIVSPTIAMGAVGWRPNEDELRDACREVARSLGIVDDSWHPAVAPALAAQRSFEQHCEELGRMALGAATENDLVPVVVLGRTYTIHNTVLNSNVPAILRERGALAIPVDCYPIQPRTPVFEQVVWGYGQRNLRAAHQIRRTPGVYSVFCSNYSCGPDSFNLHFYQHVMRGKPYAIVETDGHSGDAGTKTRIEAFLHCATADRDAWTASSREPRTHLGRVTREQRRLSAIKAAGDLLLVAHGPGRDIEAAALRQMGLRAEVLPPPDPESIALGRRHTSGKECLPIAVLLGGYLHRVQQDPNPEQRFAIIMPTARGPCRFPAYSLLSHITLHNARLRDRIGVWTPSAEDTDVLPPAFGYLGYVSQLAVDLLLDCANIVQPVARRADATRARLDQALTMLRRAVVRACTTDLSFPGVYQQAHGGALFGVPDVIRSGVQALVADCDRERRVPTVLVAGESYVRGLPSVNGDVVRELQREGIRARLSAQHEWEDYVAWAAALDLPEDEPAQALRQLRERAQQLCYGAVAEALGRDYASHDLPALIQGAGRYIRPELLGESILTVGAGLQRWRNEEIHGLVNVGPLECMTTKIAQAQLFHVAQQEGLPSITLSFNGDPLDAGVLEGFVYEVRQQFNRGRRGRSARRRG